MNILPASFSTSWLVVGVIACAWVYCHALRQAQWWRLKNSHDLNVLLYTLLGVFTLWLLNTDIKVGEEISRPTLHLLGATLMSLMFGWSFAVLAMGVVVIVFSLFSLPVTFDNIINLPWAILMTGVLPVSISYAIFRGVDHYLPNNYFVYIFLGSFFNAALCMASVVLVSAAVHTFSGSYRFDTLANGYIPYGLILVFPEAFITGMLMSIFVVYRPQWVSSFDDARYLRNR